MKNIITFCKVLKLTYLFYLLFLIDKHFCVINENCFLIKILITKNFWEITKLTNILKETLKSFIDLI